MKKQIPCLAILVMFVLGRLVGAPPGTLTTAAVTPTDVYNDTSITSLTAGNVTIEVNDKAGGSVWSWKYKGHEYLNRFDYGRLFQPAFFAEVSTNNYNPTEGGAGSYTSGGVRYEMGSASLYVNADNTAKTMVTITEPLEFLPENFGGARNGTAVYYDGFRFGKTITLNWQGHDKVARFETVMYTPQGYASDCHIVNPAFFIRACFTEIYEWSDSNGPVLNSWPSSFFTSKGYPNDLTYPSSKGGLIVRDPTSGYTMGFYMPLHGGGGSITNFSWWNISTGTSNGPEDDDCYAVFPATGYSFPGNQWLSYRVFVVMGESVSEVATEMAWLASNNYN